jgi:acyl-CoA thioesterase I
VITRIVGGTVLLSLVVWGGLALQVRASIDDLASYWAQPQGEAGGLVYVALGDSAAQGVGASGPDHGYVGVVADRLRDATGSAVQVINLSESGATVSDVVDGQLPRLDGLCADLITVGVGGNDVRDHDAEAFADDLDALIDGLPREAILAEVPYFMHGHWQDHAQMANEQLLSRARAAEMDVAPLHQAMEQRGWMAMATDYAADWFHPNDRGHRVWAQAMWTTIEPRVDGLRPGC